MRTFMMTTAASALTLALTAGASAQTFTVEGEVLFMTRTESRELLFVDYSPTVTAVTEDELVDYNWSAGFALSLGYRISEGQSLNLTGFWLAPQKADGLEIDTGENLYSASTSHENPAAPLLPSGDVAYAAQFDFESSLWGIGGNYSFHLWNLAGVDMTGRAGLRYISFTSESDSAFFDEEDDFLGTHNEILATSLSLENNLYGGDIGISLGFPLANNVSFGVDLGLGLYLNDADRSRNVNDPQSGFTLNDSASSSDLAASVEAGASLAWAVMDGVTVQAGYKVMFLSGVADSAEQFANSAVANDDFEADGIALFHGGFAGVNLAF